MKIREHRLRYPRIGFNDGMFYVRDDPFAEYTLQPLHHFRNESVLGLSAHKGVLTVVDHNLGHR